MRIALIAAVTRNRVIGRDGRLPWRLPDETKHFVETTMGKPVLMGRRTYEERRKPLRGRTTIVLTRDPDYRAPGCVVVHSIEEAIKAAGDAEELIVAGGTPIYEAFLPRASRLYMTFVEADVPGDTYFPEYDAEEWVEVSSEAHPADDRHAHAFRIVLLERKT